MFTVVYNSLQTLDIVQRLSSQWSSSYLQRLFTVSASDPKTNVGNFHKKRDKDLAQCQQPIFLWELKDGF